MKRKLTWAAAIVAVGCCLLAGVYVFRDVLIAPHLKAWMRETVREQLGLEVSIGRVGGSLLADLEIQDVQTIASDTAAPVSTLSLQHVRLRYSLGSLLKGISAFIQSARVDAEGLRLAVDLDRGDDSHRDGTATGHALPVLPELRIRDAEVSIRINQFHLDLKKIRLETGMPSPEGRPVHLQVSEGSWTHPLIRPGSGSIAADLRLTPDALRVDRLLLNGEPLIEQAYLAYSQGTDRFPFAARLRVDGGRLDLQGEATDADIHSNLKAQEIQLAAVADLFKLDVDGHLSMEAEVRLPLANPVKEMTGRLSLSLRNGSFRGMQKADLRASASLSDGWLRLETLELDVSHSHAVLTGAAARWNDLLEFSSGRLLRKSSGEFRLHSEDLPALLVLAGIMDAPAATRIPDHRLVLAGRIKDGGILIPDLELTSRAGSIFIHDLETSLEPFGAETPVRGDLRLQVSGLAEIASILGLPPLGGSLTGEIAASGRVGRLVGHAELKGTGLVFNGQPLGNGSLRAAAEHESIRVESLNLRNGRDRLQASGTVDLGKGRLDGVLIDYDLVEIETYSRLLLPDAWRTAEQPLRIQGSVKGRARLSGPWEDPDGELAVDFESLQVRGRRFGNGSARIAKQGHTFAVADLKCVNGADRLDARGSYDFDAQRFGATRMELHAENIEAYLNAFAPDEQWLTGKVAGKLEGSGPLLEPAFTLDLAAERMQADGWTARDTHISARGAERRVRIESAETSTAVGRVFLAGDIVRPASSGSFDLTLTDFAIRGEDLVLALKSVARVRYTSPGIFTVDGFHAAGPQGSLTAQGTLSPRGNSDLGIRLSAVSGAGWLPKLTGIPLAVEGLDAALRVKGTAALPEITASGTIQKVGVQEKALAYSGRFEISYSAKALRIDDLDLNDAEGHRIALNGTLPLDPAGSSLLAPGPLTITATIRVPDLQPIRALWPDWPLASGSLEADLSLNGSWQVPGGVLRIRGRSLAPSEDTPFPPGSYEAVCEATLAHGRLLLQTLQISGPAAEFHAQGRLERLAALPELFSRASTTNWGQVSLSGRLSMADLGWLARSLKDVRRTSGRIEVRMALDGPLHGPDLHAELNLSEGEIRPEGDIPALQSLNLQARLTGRDLEIESLRGQMGGAPFELSGRFANLFTPLENGRTDLRLNGENLLLYRSDALRLRANTNLTLTGPVSQMTLAGGVVITDGFYGKNFGLLEGLESGTSQRVKGRGIELFSIESAPFRDTVFDIRITAAEPFQIKNNLVRGSARPDLLLSGTGRTPTLAGKIYLEPSILYLPAGRMRLESGMVRFERSDPGRPELDLVGTSRMLGYDITAVAEGPYDEPTVTLSSVPPLPDQELLMLLLTGQTPKTSGSRASESGRGLNVAVFFGRDLMTRIEGGESTETLQTILERFDVEVGRFVTRSGDETINAEFRLADDVIREGDTLYLTGEKDIFDYFNAGIKIVFRFR